MLIEISIYTDLFVKRTVFKSFWYEDNVYIFIQFVLKSKLRQIRVLSIKDTVQQVN